MASQSPGTAYRFGYFRYDPAQRQLYRGEETIPLAPKAIDTLHVLLERRGQIVGKDELMKLVWPDCVVEEIGLARNISILRKALGDDAGALIETVPKRGYRFSAEAGAGAPPPRAARRPTWFLGVAALLGLAALIYWQFYRPSRFLPPAGRSASLAVIPFEPLSPDLERSAFLQGLSEALVEEISRLKSAQVISPSTVRRYRQVGISTALMARLLGLDVVVEGAAQGLGGRTHVSVRLTDVHSGKLIWAEGYDLAPDDPARSQAAARAMAAEIGRRLAP